MNSLIYHSSDLLLHQFLLSDHYDAMSDVMKVMLMMFYCLN